MDGDRLSGVVEDARWPRASVWLRGRSSGGLGVLGVPLHRGSLTPGRCDLAPGAIRAALSRYSTWDSDARADVRDLAVVDAGDLDVAGSGPEEALGPVATETARLLEAVTKVVLVGGDNSVTRPGARGVAEAAAGDLSRVGVLTLDAHHDLRDTDGGLTNGNPVRALLEDGLPGRNVVQVGIQAFANSSVYAQEAAAAGITAITAPEVRRRGIDEVVGEALDDLSSRTEAVYVDLDVDVLDRAFAPACPGARPGGLTPGEVQAAARTCGRHPAVRVLDVVEVDPERDVADVTVLAAASFLLAFAAGAAAGERVGPLPAPSRRR